MGIVKVLINFIKVKFTYNKGTHGKCIVPGVLINSDTHVHPNPYKNIFITTKFPFDLWSKLSPVCTQATADLISVFINQFSLFENII